MNKLIKLFLKLKPISYCKKNEKKRVVGMNIYEVKSEYG